MAKVMVSMPDELLVAVDAAAQAQSRARSELIREALRLYLAQGSADRRSEALDWLRASFKGIRLNAEEIVRSERDR